MSSISQQFARILASRYREVLDACIFLVCGALLTLGTASVLEYQIEQKSIEIERLVLKRESVLGWIESFVAGQVENTGSLLEAEFLIRSLSIENMQNPELEARNIIQEAIVTGPYTFQLFVNDLTDLFNEDILEEEVITLTSATSEVVSGVENFLLAPLHMEQELASNWRQRFDELYNSVQALRARLLQTSNTISQNIQEQIDFTRGELLQLTNISSRIVLFSFVIQLFIYFLLQYFEIFTDRRKAT